MFVQSTLRRGPGPGRWHCTGRNEKSADYVHDSVVNCMAYKVVGGVN